MKKKGAILILALILIVASLATIFSACTKKEPEQKIEPTQWQGYVGEIVALATKNYHIAKNELFLDTNIVYEELDKNGKNFIKYDTNIKINYSANGYSNQNAIFIETDKYINFQKTQKLFGLYSASEDGKSNDDLYLYLYNEEYNKEEKYHYSNAPIFEFLQQSFSNKSQTDTMIEVADLLTQTITYCSTDKQKSQYVLDVNIGELLHGLFFDSISDLLNILPLDFTQVLYGLIQTQNKAEFEKALLSIKGQIKVEVKDEKILSYNVSNLSVNGKQQNFLTLQTPHFVLSKTPISIKNEQMPTEQDGYEQIKIGTVNFDGKLDFFGKNSYNKLVTYDLSFISSVDLIKLMVNDFDLYQIDEDNYFHFRMSHKCNHNCTDYCSVEQGNKFMPANGAILDVAYSPKDFGTHNIYISVAMKAFVGANSMPHIEGINELYADHIFADYQLIVVDPLVVQSNLLQALKPNGSFFNLLKTLNGTTDEIPFTPQQLTEVVGILFGEGGEKVAEIAQTTYENLNVGKINFELKSVQYGATQNYDIKQKALYTIAEVVDEGVGVKQYNNFVNPDSFKPMLDWKFIGENDIYNIYAPNGEQLYGINKENGFRLPIAYKEVEDLKGGYITLNYVDITGSVEDYEKENWAKDENGNPIVAKAYILDVLNVKNTQDEQIVTLKVANPNNNLISRNIVTKNRLFERDTITDFFNKYLYDYVDIRIKFTPLLKIDVEGAVEGDNGGEITNNYEISSLHEYEYEKIVTTQVTNYYYHNEKKYKIIGETDIFDVQSVLSINTYYFNCTGEQLITYNVVGKKYTRKINIISPDAFKFVRNAQDDYIIAGKKNMVNDVVALNVVLTYGEKDRNIKLSLARIKINGKSIYDTNSSWQLSYDGLTEYITFNKNGNYTISADFLNNYYTFVLSVGTQSNLPSTYKLTCLSPISSNGVGGVGIPLQSAYMFDNRTIGAEGIANAHLQIEVFKLGEDGNFERAGEDDYLLNKITIGDSVVQNNYVFENLPAIVFEPYKIKYNISVLNKGEYQITICVKVGVRTLTSHSQYIFVY